MPEDARAALVRWREGVLADRDDLRPVRAEALHLTLVFFGYRPERELPAITETVVAAAAGHEPPRLAALGVRAVPPRRPRLFALDLDDEGARATTLQASLSAALAERRLYRPEKRPFWPHVTFARVKSGGRAGPLDSAAPPPAGAFEASELTLYRSILRPQGALYEPLQRTDLAAP